MTDFEEWRRDLKRDGKGPVDLPSATRGLPWALPVEIDGDWTGGTLVGRIRAAPDASTALVTMTTSGPAVAGGVSVFTLSLTGVQTGALPGDDDGDGLVQLPYALLLSASGGDLDTLVGGVFTVRGLI